MLLTMSATLLIGLAAAVAGWFLWLPRYRPALQRGEQYGVDVSSHQGTVDWRAVRADHISFAYIKVTEGATFEDPQFSVNWSAAAQAGVLRGAYHFFTLCSPGAAQAANFLGKIGADVGELPPAIDLELAGNCHNRPPLAEVRAQLSALVNAVERRTHRRVLLYLGNDFAEDYPLAIEQHRSLWLRRFLRAPSRSAWTVWQVDDRASVRGIRGAVDLDVSRQRA